ncbi:hypothetical protein LZK98_11575 [Sphingomonas cannabina]|uniref:hypothetical protein n=1 Tax=Sphingomonas cannabina TaxID=2899123 RepID=UPI001F1BCD6D|nr:hypothetical protein [Sphingomonas cannabina]UIJ43730.1 hypothetical protein LZK98_11575 [Sphingomonas cannabina]
MTAALDAPRKLLAGLVRIELPNHTLRLCDGSAAIQWGADVFAGKDSVYGTIGEVEMINEEVGDVMPGLDISMLPPALSAAQDLVSPAMQGAPVRVWLAVIDPVLGTVIPDPELLFAGEVDQPVLEVERGTRRVTFRCASVFERLMEPEEGARLSDSFHQWVWPGELGMSRMTGTPINKLWGPGDKPPAATQVPQIPRRGVQLYF